MGDALWVVAGILISVGVLAAMIVGFVLLVRFAWNVGRKER